MLLLAGIPSEGPLALVAEEAGRRGVEHLLLSQRATGEAGIILRADPDGQVGGLLEIAGRGVPLAEITGAYLRLMDARVLPELAGEPADSPARRRAQSFADALYQWAEVSPARVVNRPSAMGSNGSKPYQARLVTAFGFDIPETLVTNDPDAARAFRDRFPQVIYKSVSGVRSVVETFTAADFDRLGTLRWCPTQFQEKVEGFDVRVHVVGEAVFATRVESEATDYRYAATQVGAPAELSPFQLSDDVAERCVAMSACLGLAFAGIDLRFARDGRVICFEVNPCPGFSYYEHHTGQPIAAAVVDYLAGAQAGRVAMPVRAEASP